MSPLDAPLGDVLATIRGHHFHYVDEDELQAGLTAVLRDAGLVVDREVRLDGAGRVDLLVGGVAIEVKVGGSAGALLRQITRYAQSERIDAIIAVTSRVRHLGLPDAIAGKPVFAISVAAL